MGGGIEGWWVAGWWDEGGEGVRGWCNVYSSLLRHAMAMVAKDGRNLIFLFPFIHTEQM